MIAPFFDAITGAMYAPGAACYRWLLNRPGMWLVTVGNYGLIVGGGNFCTLLNAVVDDFGDLVRV